MTGGQWARRKGTLAGRESNLCQKRKWVFCYGTRVQSFILSCRSSGWGLGGEYQPFEIPITICGFGKLRFSDLVLVVSQAQFQHHAHHY